MSATGGIAAANRRIHPVPSGDLVRVYVWEWPVRVTHWLIALSIVVLAVTGILIGTPTLLPRAWGGRPFVIGTIKTIHSYFAIVFTLSVLSRIVWMFLGNAYARWSNFIPVHRQRRRGLLATLQFYLFLLRKPPGYVGHNPLAGMTYVLVFFLYFTMIATGFALYSASAGVRSPMRAFQFLIPLLGGLQAARWIHHVVMWLLLGFAVHHVYSSVLMSQVEANATVESIVSGYKFVPREDVVEHGARTRRAAKVPAR
jgi:Ni/Fe-hydrogenase 1 B-type cytochrome subunit